MKTILTLLLLAASAGASPVTLEWDHDQQPGDRYILRAGEQAFPATDAKRQTVDLQAGAHILTVSAVSAQGVESAPSTPFAVSVPATPGGLRIKVTVVVEAQ